MREIENIYGGNRATVSRGVTAEMVASRQTQEALGQIVMAKRFPRNEIESYGRIIRACQRKSLAEQAMYEYPRGGQKVTGPSIRLAEAIAQNWGNLDFGFVELEQRGGESQVMAYAWDLETNTRQTKIFSVPHVRGTKKGNIPLTDPRDIYELVANQAARRVRACILGIIPGDVIDAAIEQCNVTMMDGADKPIIDLVRDMSNIFQKEFSVPLSAIEEYIGCKSEAFSMNDLVRLKKVYRSLKDGMAKREDYFNLSQKPEEQEIQDPFEKKKTARGKKQVPSESPASEPRTEEGDGFVPERGIPQDGPFV